jgi:microcystin-dependent protein
MPYAGTVAPTGWLACDGQSYDSIAQSQYATLYSIIGTTYGGTGANDFKVPDFLGRTLRGSGQVGGVGTTYANGQTGGSDSTTMTLQNVAPHRHEFTARTGSNSSASGSSYTVADINSTFYTAGGIYDNTNTLVTAEGTGPTPMDVRNPFGIVLYIIKF